jgi:anaerobic selenocysteine-containing dehydrogenase
MLFGERITANLIDEIETPGEGQIRALFVLGGNPAGAIPDTRRTVRALSSLDLLVAIEPYRSETARIADYVLPPRLQYERSDISSRVFEGSLFEEPFCQYTPKLLADPTGSDLCDDWYPLWGVAKRLGRPFRLDGVELDYRTAPDNDDLIQILARHGSVPLGEIMAIPGGAVFPVPPQTIEEPPAEARERFELLPGDIAEELRQSYAAATYVGEFGFRLSVRRMREAHNTMYAHSSEIRKRRPYNPAHLSEQDFASLELADGDWVQITSEEGSIVTRARVDRDLRNGVVSITHGFGGLDGDSFEQAGARVNDLISLERHVEAINVMPRMTGIPVNVTRSNGH